MSEPKNVSLLGLGVIGGEPLLDLCYREDSGAGVDMNVVAARPLGVSAGADVEPRFVEVQGTGESDTFSRREDVVLARHSGLGCDQSSQLRPVGTSPMDTTLDGVVDLGGNVAEWVQDRFEKTYRECPQPCRDPVAPEPDNRPVREETPLMAAAGLMAFALILIFGVLIGKQGNSNNSQPQIVASTGVPTTATPSTSTSTDTTVSLGMMRNPFVFGAPAVAVR